MTPRCIRRAAERKALKAARKAANRQDEVPILTQSSPLEESPLDQLNVCAEFSNDPLDESLLFTLSPAQLAANRSNAQLSSGPKTANGKASSSLNAVKTALTGRTVLLPTDDSAAYQDHLRAYQDDFRPVGVRECDLVQSIADTAWRLKRIPCLEAAIFAQGHVEFAEAFNTHEPSLRSSMIELQTYLKYEKQLRNLQLQESRLARRREKELAELRSLQAERRSAEQEALELVASRYQVAQASGHSFEPGVNGFVFSTAQIEAHLERLESRRRAPESSFSSSRIAQQAA